MALPALQAFVDQATTILSSWLNRVDWAVTPQTDTGVVNAYVIANAPVATQGARVTFTPANTNTGAVTVNGAAALRANGTACTGGEFSSLGPVVLQSTGTQWQIVSTAGAQPGFERTAAELAAAVVPASYVFSAYNPGSDVRRYGNIDLTGASDCRSILNTANSVGVALYFPPGTYRISSALTLSVTCFFDQGAILKPDASTTVTISGSVVAPASQIFNVSNASAVVTGLMGRCDLNVLWWGADPSGAADSTNAIQQAINCAPANVSMPAGTFLITSGLKLALNGLHLFGAGFNQTTLNYPGSVFGIDGYTNGATSYCVMERFTLLAQSTGNPFGIILGKGARNNVIRDCGIYGIGNASATSSEGINLNSGTPGIFSGQLKIENCIIQGFWKGIHALSNSATNTWTGIQVLNTFVNGNSPITAGSIGVHFDTWTNGTGSTFYSGTVEGFATGLQIDNPATPGVGFGFDYCADLEGNTVPFSIGSGFSNRIRTSALPPFSEQVPLTGFSITIADLVENLKLRPAGTLATGTITMPAHPYQGQVVRVSSTQTVTTLTVSANGGQSIVGAPTTITSATPFGFVWDQANAEWSRV